MWWHARRLWPVMLLGPVVFGAPLTFPQFDPAGDARAVYCLKPENARPLVDTAVSLGLARHSGDPSRLRPAAGAGTLTVAAWRRADPARFTRACAALVRLRQMPDTDPAGPFTGVGTTLTVLIPVIAGAVLALGTTLLTGRQAAATQAAADLAGAASRYYRTCRRCLDAWRRRRGGDLLDELREPYEALCAELALCHRRHPKWRATARAEQDLENLDAAIRDESWKTPGQAAKAHEERLLAVHAQILDIAIALEHPLRRRHRVRAR